MGLLAWIILFCFMGGALSVLAAALVLLLPKQHYPRALPHLVSFAIGALLGAAFLALLPHALEEPEVASVHSVTLTILLGLIGFFVLEKLVLWRHCHHTDCEAHEVHVGHNENRAIGMMVLVGDSFHNFVDGVLIAAAFLTDFHLGVVTSTAVAAHEIPQEVGNFIVLLQSGFSKKKALKYNILVSTTTVLGGVLGYYLLADLLSLLPYLLAVAASSFIYIAVADLIPGLHKRLQPQVTLQQIIMISLGVMLIYVAHEFAH